MDLRKEKIKRPVDRYDDEDGDGKLTEAEESVKEVEREIIRAEDELETLQEEIAALAQQISESDNRRSTINNNLRYREAERKIADLEKEIEGIDVEGASKAKRDFEAKYGQVDRERTAKHGKVSWASPSISCSDMLTFGATASTTRRRDFSDEGEFVPNPEAAIDRIQGHPRRLYRVSRQIQDRTNGQCGSGEVRKGT